ncbi:uncharacterized protein LOC114359482 isoform X1 [Ostrinia furnacalis]|uniref:uncharacterized protein LOC114359482 isoform X1 n=1 Tax=Ostrinia furnacalis TaxID=93504 RepID=UPI00103EE1DF|nr:uncharacterized protein LOC114359482 isoform X1 [Ostrinia furnacalis]XP_028169705.1 uncharacterized protein LOC114359482 isoform X1 [Ostrinia furnacalis]
MENNKQQDLSDDDYKQESPSNTWNPTKETDNSPGDIKSRKRKIESEPSENGKSISTETVLVANRENTPFFADQPSSDLYGLKPEFLKSLGINLPLSKWVYVTNFRCDKSELKDVFELAGHVVICSMIAVRNRYANVMFNHPLEAVQAISMFNGQNLYGQNLKVMMINPPSDTIILPKGLKDIGPGLGFNGRPLRDVEQHYRKYKKHQRSLLDVSVFTRDNDDEEKEHLDIKKEELDTNSCNSSEKTDSSKRRKYFKTTNVQDLSICEESAQDIISENASKKPRLDEIESSSDEENIDARIVTPSKLKDKQKPPEKNTFPNDPRLNPLALSTSASDKKPPAITELQQKFPPSGLQFPNQPGNIRPGPFHPPGPVMNPVRPMMGPVGPSGPMMQPIGANVPIVPMHPNVPIRPCPPVRPQGPLGHPGSVGPQVPIGPITGPIRPYMPGPYRPPTANVPVMQGPNPAMGPRPMISPNGPPSGPNQLVANKEHQVLFRNLPPSTTFPLLCDEVSRCGRLLSLQLTTPGCAVARFGRLDDAQRCFQYFNGKRIDGFVIEACIT